MENRKYRSFFWPILLIGIGTLWLLSNLGIISGVNFGTIFRFWPLILIVVGLDLIVGRLSGLLSAVIAVLTVLILAALLVAAPSLGLRSNTDANYETFTAEVADAEFAEVTLDLSSYATTIQPLPNNDNLFDAQLGYYGEVRFTDSGSTNRRIRLEHYSSPDNWFSFDQMALRWEIGLNSDLPTDLFVDGGSGSIDMDLSKMSLTALTVDGGSGSIDMSLPTSPDGYTARLDTGSGSVRVRITGNQNLTLEMDSGSGAINISLPTNAAVRIEALDDGSGAFRIPAGFDQIEIGDDRDEGVWQSAGFESAKDQIIIRITDAGSGSITIR